MPAGESFSEGQYVAASPENAPVNSPARANGIVGASAPLRLADRACSRVDGKIVVNAAVLSIISLAVSSFICLAMARGAP